MTQEQKILLCETIMAALRSGDLTLAVETNDGPRKASGYGFNKYDGEEGAITFRVTSLAKYPVKK